MSIMSDVLPLYRGDLGRAYGERHLNVPARLYQIVSKARSEKFMPWITPKMRVFEFGVGTGLNLAQLQCRRKVGYDVQCALLEGARRARIQFRWETGSIKSGSFDAVICHHVLEHVTDPWKVLAELSRLVVPGGVVLINVPHEIESTYRKYDPNLSNGHLFSWTPQTLGTLAENRGFEIERIGIQPFGYDRFAAVAVSKTGLGDVSYRLLRKLLLFLRPRYEICAVLRKPC